MSKKDELVWKLLFELEKVAWIDFPIATRLLVSTALDAYALSIVEQSVPEEKALGCTHDPRNCDHTLTPEEQGFNSCRAETLENARKLTQSETT
jgi:hypothetical protein